MPLDCRSRRFSKSFPTNDLTWLHVFDYAQKNPVGYIERRKRSLCRPLSRSSEVSSIADDRFLELQILGFGADPQVHPRYIGYVMMLHLEVMS